MPERSAAPAPAWYAAPRGRRRGQDWWAVLHPPYTAWHLSYVVIGAALAPQLHLGRLAVTVLAFFLAVGVAAHAFDELRGRPLATRIPGPVLLVTATAALAAAALLGVAGVTWVGPGLLPFVAAGTALVLLYNLEWAGGRFHTDAWFAAAWGAFPVLVGSFVQRGRLDAAAAVAAAAAFALSRAQRVLSTHARALRRRVATVVGTVTYRDGSRAALDAASLLRPAEGALVALSWAVPLLALALLAAHLS